MEYSKEQQEYSDFILKTIAAEGGSMEYYRLAGLMSDRWNYDTAPAVQLRQLVETEGMAVRRGEWVILTKDGRKAAEKGFAKMKTSEDTIWSKVGVGTWLSIAVTIAIAIVSWLLSQ